MNFSSDLDEPKTFAEAQKKLLFLQKRFMPISNFQILRNETGDRKKGLKHQHKTRNREVNFNFPFDSL